MSATNRSDDGAGFSALRLSLREYLGLITIVMLATGLAITTHRLSTVGSELKRLRASAGYLGPTPENQVAAIRGPADQPLTYRFSIRVPQSKTGYRIAYSSLWPDGKAGPQWFSAAPVPTGDSTVTVRIMKDPRDDVWKLAVLVQSSRGARRMATVLPADQESVFRGSHDVISTGIARNRPVIVDSHRSIRLLDERWLVGEGALMLYGDKPPSEDQIGVFAELQPDLGSLR